MATAGSKEKLLGVFVDDFTCGICLEIYESKKRKPKVLPCAHSICSSCLVQCAKHNAEREFEHPDNDADQRFRCPFCKQKIRLQPADVDKFPNNVDKMQLMEKIMGLAKKDLSQENKIHSCEKHGNEASHVCETCDEFLCGQCMSMSIKTGEHANHEVGLLKDSLAENIELLIERKTALTEVTQAMMKKEIKADGDLEKAKTELHRNAKELHQQIDNWQADCSKTLDEALHEKNQARKNLQKTLDDIDKKLKKAAEEMDGSSSFTETSRLLEVTDNIKSTIENFNPMPTKVQLPDIPRLTLGKVSVRKEIERGGQTLEELCRQVEGLWLGESQGEATREGIKQSKAARSNTLSESPAPPETLWPAAMTWRMALWIVFLGIDISKIQEKPFMAFLGMFFAMRNCSEGVSSVFLVFLAIIIFSLGNVFAAVLTVLILILLVCTAKHLPFWFQVEFMQTGATVTRGPDWGNDWDEDGGPGGVGTVVEWEGDYIITVKWERTGIIKGYWIRPSAFLLRLA